MDLIDLHTHSTASDGTDSPSEVVRLAKAAGLSAIALTDHDTVDGLEEAEAAGAACGLPVVRGCELASQTPYGEAHIVGLWLPKDISPLQDVLDEMLRNREQRNRDIVQKINELGMEMSYDEVLEESRGGSVGRPHIAAVMLKRKYVSSIREAFNKYMGKNGPAFVARKVLEPQAAVRLLREIGATPVLAHPGLIGCPYAWLADFVRSLTEAGLTAIEAYHSEHSAAQTREAVELAAANGLDLSGGSDYHGRAKPGISLGTGRGGLRVPAYLLEKLADRRIRLGLPV